MARSLIRCSILRWSAAAVTGLALVGPAGAETGKVPLTTKSPEARRLYLEGRDLAEKLRATEARKLYEQAAAKDPDFALAYLGLANTAPSAKAFFEDLAQAVSKAPRASEAERQMILGLDAGVKSEPARQRELYERLVAAYPQDERALNLLGGYLFGQQEWARAIEVYERAVEVNPQFSQPYNQLGYAQRFLGHLDRAEEAFRKYIELIPNDPNPYDSYAELLMKRGRFQESIRNYEKALAQDPHFVASYVGIALDQLYQGQPEPARKTLGRLEQQARNSGERRAALGRLAFSHALLGETDQALEAIGKMSTAASGDKAAIAGDAAFMGTVLLESGRIDEAAKEYARALRLTREADVPAAVKQAAQRADLANQARVSLARGDLDAAARTAGEYTQAVSGPSVPFELWQSHELRGLVALARKEYAQAAGELSQANQQDPRVLYHLARALAGRGEKAAAREACERAAEHNGLNFNYAYVRARARKLLGEL